MKIIQYPHPTLRYKSKPITRVDRQLKSIVREMFDLMYSARGIGLAANQVDLPLQLFVLNLEGDPEAGEEMVFINPIVSAPKGASEAEEGCLSLVGVNARVVRPEQVHISAYDLAGNKIDRDINGLFARAVQHENDHLNGVMFIDRIAETSRKQLAGELEEFEIEFRSKQSTGEIVDDASLFKHLLEIEKQYCESMST